MLSDKKNTMAEGGSGGVSSGSQSLLTQRLLPFGGKGEPVWLAHANGYPPGVYRAFVNQLLTETQVTGYKHRPLWSDRQPEGRLNWNGLAQDLIHTLEHNGGDVPWVMGHSMGGTIAVLAAARRPDLFRGLLLIDPVFLPTRHIAAVRLMTERRRRRLPMIKKTLTRPDQFSDTQAAFDFHRGKRAFARFSDEVLWDYVNFGTQPSDAGGVSLAFSPQWEAEVYGTAPWIWPVLRRVRVPMLVLRGQDSDTFLPAALARVRRFQPEAVVRECPGGHLLPMEEPESTAAAVLDYLREHAG